MNKVYLMGRLTKDVEVKYTPQTQMAVARFSIACDRGKDKNGQSKGADFPSCVAFGKTAENLEKYCTKGGRVMVEGRWQTGSYKNNAGDTIYTNEMAVDRLEIIDWKQNTENGQNTPQSQNQAPQGFSEIDEDIPF